MIRFSGSLSILTLFIDRWQLAAMVFTLGSSISNGQLTCRRGEYAAKDPSIGSVVTRTRIRAKMALKIRGGYTREAICRSSTRSERS